MQESVCTTPSEMTHNLAEINVSSNMNKVIHFYFERCYIEKNDYKLVYLHGTLNESNQTYFDHKVLMQTAICAARVVDVLVNICETKESGEAAAVAVFVH